MSGMTLAALQSRLQAYILDGDANAAPVCPLLDGRFGLAREARLDIYHTAYRARLREALGTVFERTWCYVGDEVFATVANDYIERTPSHSANLRDYGASFSRFLATALPADPEVAELAHIDWLLHDAFDAPDRPGLQPDALASLSEADWACAGFGFAPGVALAEFGWNTLEIWHALDRQATPPAAFALVDRHACLFWRKDGRSHFRSLSAAEHRMLTQLLAGAGFASACASVVYDEAAAAGMVGPWLQQWIHDGLISVITNMDGTDGMKPNSGALPE